MASLLWYMSSCACVIHQEGRGHFLIGRHALFWSGKVVCGTVDQTKNLVRRTIRSMQEPSADLYSAPNCHGKSKSLTAKANHSRQEQTREARVNGKHGVNRCPSVKSNNISIKAEQTGKMVQTDFVYWRKRFDVVIYLCKHERIMSLIAVYHNKQTRDTKYVLLTSHGEH